MSAHPHRQVRHMCEHARAQPHARACALAATQAQGRNGRGVGTLGGIVWIAGRAALGIGADGTVAQALGAGLLALALAMTMARLTPHLPRGFDIGFSTPRDRRYFSVTLETQWVGTHV